MEEYYMAVIDEKLLWDSAEKLRGSVLPSDYMTVTLGLIFLKYVSVKFQEKYDSLEKNGDDVNDRDEYIASHIFWVPEKARWNYVASFSKQECIGQVLDKAFVEIEKDNEDLRGVLPKNYSKPDMDKRTLGDLVDLFTNKLIINDKEGDFFGQIYEYFMGKFAKRYMEKGGEYFTPRCLVQLLVSMINPTHGRVYDPCCGSGGMFVQTAEFIKAHRGNVNNISVYGQEKLTSNWKLAKMNLAIRGISCDLGNGPGDTFFEDKHKGLRCDYILANPPFNVSKYRQKELIGDSRWIFGTPPEGNSNYAWMQHIYSKLAPNGIAAFVMANGVLSTSSKQELEIRKNMLEAGVVDCIISCPTNLFYTVTVPCCLWFIRKNKKDKKVLFIDARNEGKMIDRKVREFSKSDIKKITSIYKAWKGEEGTYEDIKGFCKSSSLEDIRDADYTLVPGRYVGIDDSNKMSKEEIDAEIKRTSKELLDLFEENKKLEEKVKEILKQNL